MEILEQQIVRLLVVPQDEVADNGELLQFLPPYTEAAAGIFIFFQSVQFGILAISTKLILIYCRI